MFNGLGTNMHNLHTLSNARTRSICGENRTGAKGMGGMCEVADGVAGSCARDLGRGWKVSPYIRIPAGETAVLADIGGSGAINHIWITPQGPWRDYILRMYWDDNAHPSVECPLGDFFASGWGEYRQINSLAVCVNPGSAFNCYWTMPFRKRAYITVENRSTEERVFFYQIDYSECDIPEDAAYFHAQFRRVNPLPYKDVYTIVDGIQGKGHYVGTHMAWGVNNNGWWGEGEIKFFMDGDGEYPTICGTGTEDYFCGSYDFEHPVEHEYVEFSTPYAGFNKIERTSLYRVQQRFNMYRWHITDPIRFESDLKVTIQALGWRSGGRYLPLMDDIASVAYWYQTLPFAPFPQLPDKDYCEII